MPVICRAKPSTLSALVPRGWDTQQDVRMNCGVGRKHHTKETGHKVLEDDLFHVKVLRAKADQREQGVKGATAQETSNLSNLSTWPHASPQSPGDSETNVDAPIHLSEVEDAGRVLRVSLDDYNMQPEHEIPAPDPQ